MIYPSIHTFIHSFFHLIIHPFIHCVLQVLHGQWIRYMQTILFVTHHSFIIQYIQSLFIQCRYSFIHTFFIQCRCLLLGDACMIYSFIHSSIHPSIPTLILSFNYPSMHTFIHCVLTQENAEYIHLFINPFIHPFHTLILSFN